MDRVVRDVRVPGVVRREDLAAADHRGATEPMGVLSASRGVFVRVAVGASGVFVRVAVGGSGVFVRVAVGRHRCVGAGGSARRRARRCRRWAGALDHDRVVGEPGARDAIAFAADAELVADANGGVAACGKGHHAAQREESQHHRAPRTIQRRRAMNPPAGRRRRRDRVTCNIVGESIARTSAIRLREVRHSARDGAGRTKRAVLVACAAPRRHPANMTARIDPNRLRFGIFMAPFHRVGENPTLALERDLELIELLDRLGYDEAWIGEHHSAGWEIIASPELMIAAAAQRTQTIKLGTGVSSLPYHHPLILADRMVQLDHMTRGRAMFGVGPGALTSDAYQLGIDAVTQRPRMDEALGVILRLLNGETVDHESDWFTLRGARLQLANYTHPHLPVAVASSFSPAGPNDGRQARRRDALGDRIAARRHDERCRLVENGRRAGREARQDGESRRLARRPEHAPRRQPRRGDERHPRGCTRFYTKYFGETLGSPAGGPDFSFENMVNAGSIICGTPDDAIEAVERVFEITGGMGAILFQAGEWTTWEKTRHSYELWARYVAPRFQGQIQRIEENREWVAENRGTIFSPSQVALGKAFEDAGLAVPEPLLQRMNRGKLLITNR